MSCPACGRRFGPGDRTCEGCGTARGAVAGPPIASAYRPTADELVAATTSPAGVARRATHRPAAADPLGPVTAGEWVLVGDELVAAEEPREGVAPPVRHRRRWPAVVGVAAVAAVLVAGRALPEPEPARVVRVLPSGVEQEVSQRLASRPQEQWRLDVPDGRQVLAAVPVALGGDAARLVVVLDPPAGATRPVARVLDAADGHVLAEVSTTAFRTGPPPVAGAVLVGVDDTAGTLVGTDVATGAPRWTVPAEAPRWAFVPAGRSDTVLVAEGGDATVRDAATGAIRWRLPAIRRGGVALSPDLVAVVSADSRHLEGRDWADGAVRWSVPLDEAPARLSSAGDLVVVSVGDQVVAYGADGAERWRRGAAAAGLTTEATPTTGGLLLAQGDALVAVDPATGATRWQDQASVAAVVRTGDGERLFVRRGDRLVELDPASGRQVGDLGTTTPTSQVAVGRDTLVTVADGRVTGFALGSLDRRWQVPRIDATAVVASGPVLVVQAADGSLRVLR